MPHFIDVNGLRLAYRDEGDGPPLLLLHGFTGSGDDWKHVFAQPIDACRVIAPDLRGHGASTNPSGGFKFADVAVDIFALLDHLGVFRVNAIGLSAGANTLLHMATQQPSRIDAMMHVSGTPRFPEQARAIMRMMTPEQSPLWRHAHEFAEDRTDMNFSAASLSRITAKTMIVHGDRDPLYPVELALELYRAIPKASLWVVPGGGHGPIFGDDAPAFVATARKFFAAN